MSTATGGRPGAGIGKVLLVEDSMIIALDAEDALRQFGIEQVTVAGSVRHALEAIGSDPPQLALLDYNLGSESSERIAERLGELGIPFWFVTGYGDAVANVSGVGAKARGVLQKPYTNEDLARVLQEFVSSRES
ncbi:MAG: response regulator [Croceibacterium sp.]